MTPTDPQGEPITRDELQKALTKVVNRLENEAGWESRGMENQMAEIAKGVAARALEDLMDELGMDRWAR